MTSGPRYTIGFVNLFSKGARLSRNKLNNLDQFLVWIPKNEFQSKYWKRLIATFGSLSKNAGLG